MAQKKNENASVVEEKSVPAVDGPVKEISFVNTFWDQFEHSRERAEQLRENREDAYLNAVREVIKFNQQYRESITKLYEQTKKTNKEMAAEFLEQINSRKEEMKDEAQPVEPNNDREELKNQFKEVTGQLEKLALTPVKSFFQIVEKLEENFEKNTESNIAFARERRKAWLMVRKEYIKLARTTHLNLVERGKNSIKELVKTH